VPKNTTVALALNGLGFATIGIMFVVGGNFGPDLTTLGILYWVAYFMFACGALFGIFSLTNSKNTSVKLFSLGILSLVPCLVFSFLSVAAFS
jgi:hypothetical protein